MQQAALKRGCLPGTWHGITALLPAEVAGSGWLEEMLLNECFCLCSSKVYRDRAPPEPTTALQDLLQVKPGDFLLLEEK